MEKRSTHYGDIAKWIEKVINSCESYKQIFAARQLVRNFEKQLIRNHPDKYWINYNHDIISPLESIVDIKRKNLFKELED
jgi:hypothetical protein